MRMESRNPATGEVLEQFDLMSGEAVEQALAKAERAFRQFRATRFEERAAMMTAAADILERKREHWARIATTEMGKTLASAVAEVEKCALGCRYYAEHAEAQLADEPMESSDRRSFVRHLPLGPVLAIMPWNFPYWQVFRFAAPALMAGNVGLLKHAPSVPRCAVAIEGIFREAGFPEGCFQTLLIDVEQVEPILSDDRVRAATLTGSERAGKAVAALAGGVIKPTVLELGGSDPFIVMPSADLDRAVEAAVAGRTVNNGQSCIAAKRFIVHRDVYESFAGQLVARFEALTVGDPMADETDIGPLATEAIRDTLDAQVRESIDCGAVRLTGATPVDGPGFFYRPGILSEVPTDSPAYRDELFGPVAVLFKVESFDEALTLANDTRFGLGSAIFTTDEGEMERAATEIDAGATFVNRIVASDPRLPFGGIKSSGYGRELSVDGIRAFVNRKTVSVA